MNLLNLYFANKTSTNSVNQVIARFCLPNMGALPTLNVKSLYSFMVTN